ncbi:hypothetical protein [Paraburkholderia sp. SIMBA_054]|uniref:hypothetical protein n=1 Tax=Paraburkholderia sp. SIMBA_054 TaxID=3085795 RepID=UPI00397A72E0
MNKTRIEQGCGEDQVEDLSLVLLVGEIREAVDARTAHQVSDVVDAARFGHSVWTTVNGASVSAAMDRLTAVAPGAALSTETETR